MHDIPWAVDPHRGSPSKASGAYPTISGTLATKIIPSNVLISNPWRWGTKWRSWSRSPEERVHTYRSMHDHMLGLAIPAGMLFHAAHDVDNQVALVDFWPSAEAWQGFAEARWPRG